MSIASKDVEHIARLARIELTAQEVKTFTVDLAAILKFVEKLNELDTSDVLPVRGGTLFMNRMREDKEAMESIEQKQESLHESVPEKKDGWIKVKAIFDA